MRTLLAILLIAIAGPTLAQDWALLNPAYRYNYSDDGTDTISNQIRVMGVDTLGVDSFRYELNKTAEPCFDSGTDCDICIDISQFIQGACQIGPLTWRFLTPGDFIIRPRAALNEEWVFDVENGTLGVVTELVEEPILGVMDSVRTMTTALGDTVRWSKHYGIIRWHDHNGPSYTLIGVHGPGIGRLVPSLHDFFPYQAGDVYEIATTRWSQFDVWSTQTQLTIQSRSDQIGQVLLSGYAFQRSSSPSGTYYGSGPYSIAINSSTFPMLRALHTSPQEVIGTEPDNSYWEFHGILSILAHHRIDSAGYYIIESKAIEFSHLFQILDTLDEHCISVAETYTNAIVHFSDQVGLRAYFSGFIGSHGEAFSFIGGVINGDTIGFVNTAAFYNYVGIEDETLRRLSMYPDPANDRVSVDAGQAERVQYRVLNLSGQHLLVGTIVGEGPQWIDVSALSVGPYIMEVVLPERIIRARFIIAR